VFSRECQPHVNVFLCQPSEKRSLPIIETQLSIKAGHAPSQQRDQSQAFSYLTEELPRFQSKCLSREGLSFLCPQWPSLRCNATGLNQSSAFYLSHTFSTKAAEATESVQWQSSRIHQRGLSELSFWSVVPIERFVSSAGLHIILNFAIKRWLTSECGCFYLVGVQLRPLSVWTNIPYTQQHHLWFLSGMKARLWGTDIHLLRVVPLYNVFLDCSADDRQHKIYF